MNRKYPNLASASFTSEEVSRILDQKSQLSQEIQLKETQQDDKLAQIWEPVIVQAKGHGQKFDNQCCFVTPGNLARCLSPVRDGTLFFCSYHDTQLDPRHPLNFMTSKEVNKIK